MTERLEILYQDDHFIAINKPAGLLVHRSAIDRHETHFALQLLRDQIQQRVYPVHRLDKPTSGVLLFALSPAAATRLASTFIERAIEKTYFAVVRGYVTEAGRIDYPLIEDLDAATDARARRGKEAQPAITDYRPLATAELPYPVGRYATCRCTLLELTPGTGRKHQIRRHLKHIFHPIVGDTTHGDGKYNVLFREQFGWQRLLLAATRLTFTHPYRGVRVTVEAPVDEGFQRLMAQLGWIGEGI